MTFAHPSLSKTRRQKHFFCMKMWLLCVVVVVAWAVLDAVEQ